MNCDHPVLRTGDTFDQVRRVEPCLFCQRDALAARLVEAERDARRLSVLALAAIATYGRRDANGLAGQSRDHYNEISAIVSKYDE